MMPSFDSNFWNQTIQIEMLNVAMYLSNYNDKSIIAFFFARWRNGVKTQTENISWSGIAINAVTIPNWMSVENYIQSISCYIMNPIVDGSMHISKYLPGSFPMQLM